MTESGTSQTRPRESNEWLVCEEHGIRAEEGECIVHGGDACLIVVAWVDNSHVRRQLSSARSALWLAHAALRDAFENAGDLADVERLRGVLRVTLERIEEERP